MDKNWANKGQIALLPHDARDHEVLMDFLEYCRQNPALRFWQAIRKTYQSQGYPSSITRDTFYWEGKRYE